MTNEKINLERIDKLNKEYKKIYGKEIDYSIIPKGISQEKLIEVIELMIKENYSLLIAYNKLLNDLK